MAKGIWIALIAILGLSMVAGCSGGDVSEGDMQSKEKQINDATKKLTDAEAEKKPEQGQQGD